MAVGVIGISARDFWTMTPSALASVFREYAKALQEARKVADQRAAVLSMVTAGSAGAKDFDARALFPSLWDDEYLGVVVDDARVIREVQAFVDGHRAWRKSQLAAVEA